jgi:hypothetical protein
LTESFGFTGELPDKLADLRYAPLKDTDRGYYLAVHGILIADGVRPAGRRYRSRRPHHPGEGGHRPGSWPPDRAAHLARFVRSVTAAVQEFQASKAMYLRVFAELARIGSDEVNDKKGNPETVRTVYARQLAEVARRLTEQHVNPADPQIRHRVEDALSLALGDKLDGRASAIVLDLPDLDLDAGTAADIVKDNLLAVAVIYYSAMVEEWKFFSVADKVAEQFTNGMLPVTKGRGGDLLYEYIRGANQRMTEFERRGLYARALGLAQGSVEEAMPNREFADLWIRFLSASSLYNRQADQERTLVSGEQLFKSARDLSVNLSLHGYGMAHFAAAELQKLIRDVHAMLSTPDILSAYGVRDANQLVDRSAPSISAARSTGSGSAPWRTPARRSFAGWRKRRSRFPARSRARFRSSTRTARASTSWSGTSSAGWR